MVDSRSTFRGCRVQVLFVDLLINRLLLLVLISITQWEGESKSESTLQGTLKVDIYFQNSISQSDETKRAERYYRKDVK